MSTDGLLEARRLIEREREGKTGFLDLGHLGLRELPDELFALDHLTSLNLGSVYRDDRGEYRRSNNTGPLNWIAVLPPAIERLRRLETLSLGGLELCSLESLRLCPSLNSLDCHGNGDIADLSPLAGLTALTSLSCSGRQVRDLSPLAGLTALTSLSCSGTQVRDLSPLAGLTALTSLSCWGKQVRDLSPLAGLTALTSLSCSDTQVRDLSPLAGLTALTSLDCSDTQVTDLRVLIGLPHLQLLSANGCGMDDLPLTLVTKPTLKQLYLAHVTIPGIPSEVLSEAPHDDCLGRLLSHLQDLAHGVESIRDVKLIVLGNGGVGKTQLCRRLMGKPFDPTVPSTHGITIERTALGSDEGDPILNLWDFGGQDIYHGTHALFMRTRAVFLVVWNPESERTREVVQQGVTVRNRPLPYWLDYVRNLGSRDSPAIIVQSQCDAAADERPNLPAEERSLDFAFHVRRHYSAKNERGRGGLDEAIREAVQFLREREGIAAIGKGRMEVLRQLREWREADQRLPPGDRVHRTFSHAQFDALCERVGGVSSPASLLHYLHQIGAVFYALDVFDRRIILDQTWALEAVYSVFDRERSYRQIKQLHGRFTRSLLEALVWHDYAEEEQHLFLSMMQSCSVCFPVSPENRWADTEREYVAPDLLPERSVLSNQLAPLWNDGEPTIEIEYAHPFLHEGMLRSLISEWGARAGGTGIYWRYGAWAYDPETRARAIVDHRTAGGWRGRVVLRVQGGGREQLARRLVQWLEARPDWRRVDERIVRIDGRVVPPDAQGFLQERAQDRVSDRRRQEGGEESAPPVAPSLPTFGVPPPQASAEPEIFLSYAWGDGTPDGVRREEIVTQLCRAVEARGRCIKRDRTDLAIGGSIRQFMDRLAEGELVVAIVSDKYLRSPYCMYELFRIWESCRQEPARFQHKVVPVVLPDARISSMSDRLKYAEFWKREAQDGHRLITDVGPDYYSEATLKEYKLLTEFARHVDSMIAYLNDRCIPRDLEHLRAHNFAEILGLVGIQTAGPATSTGPSPSTAR